PARTIAPPRCGARAPLWLPKNKKPRIGQTRGFPTHNALPVHPWSEQNRVIRSDGLQVLRGRLAGTAGCHNLEGDLLSLLERGHSGPFHGADVDEHVITAILRLDEAETLGGVEPLNRSNAHK